jgi:ESS family glutamate:Na+ symporter
MLIERLGLFPTAMQPGDDLDLPPAVAITEHHDPDPTYASLKSLVFMLLAMGIGTWISEGLGKLGLTLPSYIGAMLVGAMVRNVDDHLHWFRLSTRRMELIGNTSLSLFLVVALMSLHLWDLAGLAMPLFINLAVQSILVVLFCCWPLLRLMGRDYDAAVMVRGFAGFMLGTTANAVAGMSSLTERFGRAPRAFLVAPVVGAFLIDFTNAIIITIFINGWK